MTVFVRDGVFLYYSHVPKTGGTSVEHFFRDNGFGVFEKDPGLQGTLNNHRFCSPQHAEAERVKRNFNIGKFDYIFATVRHPVDRVVSEYKYRCGGRDDDMNVWICSALEEQKKNPYIYDNHLRPQWEFILPGSDVFRQEEGFGDEWVGRVSCATGLSFPFPAKKVNVTGSLDLKYKLCKESLEMIVEVYGLDFDFFGYERPVV
ncbi:sulfotransferase family 2 domain-containing protein [Halomonas organivorans]|uniref:Sulfotransferase family protein n=1 Tax=Halomonas organivorans TaxID=257772 RepID=A0A7W5G4W6_9GAMM|nr:sulfotransferase family 2 domain-containing protein [Halomonas organivorans]MBB3140387.1 hypothetical protein [Halomonas organivorans]